jgi:hypothetical protein
MLGTVISPTLLGRHRGFVVNVVYNVSNVSQKSSNLIFSIVTIDWFVGFFVFRKYF